MRKTHVFINQSLLSIVLWDKMASDIDSGHIGQSCWPNQLRLSILAVIHRKNIYILIYEVKNKSQNNEK